MLKVILRHVKIEGAGIVGPKIKLKSQETREALPATLFLILALRLRGIFVRHQSNEVIKRFERHLS